MHKKRDYKVVEILYNPFFAYDMNLFIRIVQFTIFLSVHKIDNDS